MGKLDELLRELCPDGVEYKRFDEVCTLNARIGWQRLTKAEYMSKGDYLLITGTDFTEIHEIDYSTCVYVTEERYKQDPKIQLKNGDILITKDGTLGKVAQVKGLEMPATLNGGVFVVRCKDRSLENRFILHYLLSNHFQSVVEQQKTGSTISHLTQTLFSRLMIPLPPLEVQREIVRILDNFTNLTAELTAELTARGIQYSYYRNKLLAFHSDTKIVQLADIADIGTGSSNTNEAVEDGKYPFFVRSQDPLRKNDYEYDETAIITAGDGVGVGKVYHYIEGKYALHQRAYRIHINTPEVMSKYYFHYMKAKFLPYIQKTMFQGSVASIRRPMLNAFPVPVPPLDVQKRIVNVLDNFEKICSDLNIGLPAEIEARQKQYEYYRDKLLTFAETGNTILSRAEQSRAEQSRAEQSRALIKLLQYVFGYAVVTLEDIAENCDSMRKPITSGKREAGEYPYYGASGIVDYVKDYIFDGDYLLVSEDGANLLARSTPIAFSISGKNWVNNHAHVLKFDCYETRRFVEFYLNSIDLAPYISGGAQPKLNQKNLNRIEIPLPSQERQKYIVDILDRFDAICNDLSSGLPAEIEARQKQYEYYRDKLLTFKEVAAT
jgi:type I restriction enzyme S subunit